MSSGMATVTTIWFVPVFIVCLGLATAQSQPAASVAQRTKLFTDRSDHISFLYPARYRLNTGAAPSFPKGAKARRLVWLTDKETGANITATIAYVPFDLDYIRKGSPTGMQDPYWLLFTEFGPNTFYYYTGGNSAFQHPDGYYYDLNGKTLSFGFDGPYAEGSVLPDPMKAGVIEEIVLGSLKTPVSHIIRIPPSAIVYRNEQYGFQLTLTPAWRGYKVSETSDTPDGSTHLVFSVPARNAPHGFRLLSLGVQSRKLWVQRVKDCGCGTNLARSHSWPPAHAIARTPTTVFSLEMWVHDGSLGLHDNETEAKKYQIDQVVESFKLLR